MKADVLFLYKLRQVKYKHGRSAQTSISPFFLKALQATLQAVLTPAAPFIMYLTFSVSLLSPSPALLCVQNRISR